MCGGKDGAESNRGGEVKCNRVLNVVAAKRQDCRSDLMLECFLVWTESRIVSPLRLRVVS